MNFASTALFSFISCLWVSTTEAHDIEPDGTQDWAAPETLKDHTELERNGLLPAQSVVDQYKLWESGQTLALCFFSGDREAREFFVASAKVWDDIVSINFDFGKAPLFNECKKGNDYHIRVSLPQTGGNWSYIGTDALSIGQASSTVQVRVASPFSLNNKRALAGTILHELGHALALKHEHQSPESRCEEEINWPLVYDQLAQPPNSWTKEKVDHNLRRLVSTVRLDISEYDPKSIMHYSLPAVWFVNGSKSPCYTTKNTTLSNLDRTGAEEAYPQTPQQQDSYLSKLDRVSAVALYSAKLSSEDIELISRLINRALKSVPERPVETQFATEMNYINAVTTGNCSPIISKAGDVIINCGSNP